MKKRVAAFLLVMVVVLSVAASASAKAFNGGVVFDGSSHGRKK